MSVSGRDVREGVEREDRQLRDKLLSKNFVNHDNHSRPCTPEYAEGWDRIFGKAGQTPAMESGDSPEADSSAPRTSRTSDESSEESGAQGR